MRHVHRCCDLIFNTLWWAWLAIGIIMFFYLVYWATTHSYGPERMVTISRVVTGTDDGEWIVEFLGEPGLHRVYHEGPSLAPGGTWTVRRRSGCNSYNLLPPTTLSTRRIAPLIPPR